MTHTPYIRMDDMRHEDGILKWELPLGVYAPKSLCSNAIVFFWVYLV